MARCGMRPLRFLSLSILPSLIALVADVAGTVFDGQTHEVAECEIGRIAGQIVLSKH